MATDAIFQAAPYARRIEFDYYNNASTKRWFHCILAPVSEGKDELELYYLMGPDRNTMTTVTSDDFTPSMLRPPDHWSATVDKAAKKLAQQYGWSLAPLAEEGWQDRGHEWLGKKVLLFHIGKELAPGCLKNCNTNLTSAAPSPSPAPQCARMSHATSVAVADSYDGPWTRFPYILGDRPTNPAPFICKSVG